MGRSLASWGRQVSIHPFNNIRIWLGWLFGVINVPALVVIGIWFLLQYLPAFAMLDEDSPSGGVAYFAHLGGFAAGFVIIRGVVYYLRRQQAAGALTEDEPLMAMDGDLLGSKPPGEEPLEYVPTSTGIAAGAPDPFATFLPVRAVRARSMIHAAGSGLAISLLCSNTTLPQTIVVKTRMLPISPAGQVK